MSRVSKVFLATTLTIGTFIGISTVNDSIQTAQATEKPYYTYHGYIGKNPSFLIDRTFINALKYDNVTINGVKLKKTTSATKIEKFDQIFKGVSSNGKEANQVQFLIKNDLSLKSIQKAYGKNLIKKDQTKQSNNSGIFYCQFNKKSLGIWFVVDNNRVIEVSIGHEPYTTSK
ncbi:immunodominant staphylococcal antigen IsaB family protein [Staphylococcus argenteus]|uniref:immunodominant staphylococcal antigen IsaB family protein n=1 Tax=Staphylococcus argenteus TaxID=985002 RepID=UPI002863E1BE|nr:hypothetical protein [Staphylococcus argenteus]MDR7640791.1 hypothetical protein [Staphylococcus argenteus]HEE8909342.1 hypothetical protein [Staphylococcus argenteus]